MTTAELGHSLAREMSYRRVISTGLNVLTYPTVSVRNNTVITWGWAYKRDVPSNLAESIRVACHNLRRFEGGNEFARRFNEARLFFAPTRWGRFRANVRFAREVLLARSVLLHSPNTSIRGTPYWTVFVMSLISRRQRFMYSETLTPPRSRKGQIAKLVVAKACVVLVPSEVHRSYWLRLGISADRIEVIPSIYCPPPACFPATVPRLHLLYVGRPIPLKGFDRFLHLVEMWPDVRATAVLGGHHGQFAGSEPAYLEQCLSRAERLPNLEIFHEVAKVEAHFRPDSVLIAPNRVIPGDEVSAESWGRVVEEALYSGVPVVATDAVPSARHLIVDGVNGRIVAYDDDEGLFAAVADAIEGRLLIDH